MFPFFLKILFPIAIVVTSCHQTKEIGFPLAQMESPQPNPFNVLPRVDSLVKKATAAVIPSPAITSFKSEQRLAKINAHPNRHQIPKSLKKIEVDDKLIIELPFVPSMNGQDSNYHVLDNGDRLLTGRLIKMDGRPMDVTLGKTNEAGNPRFKDLSTNNIQYLNLGSVRFQIRQFSGVRNRKSLKI